LQTFNNSFLKRVFIFDLTSEDTDGYSRSYAWKPHDIVGLHEILQDGMRNRPQQDDFPDMESRLSLPVV